MIYFTEKEKNLLFGALQEQRNILKRQENREWREEIINDIIEKNKELDYFEEQLQKENIMLNRDELGTLETFMARLLDFRKKYESSDVCALEDRLMDLSTLK